MLPNLIRSIHVHSNSLIKVGILGISLLNLAHASDFQDTQGYWAEPYVQTLSDRQIIGGFPDGSFRPNDYITRAQFAAIASRALNLPTQSRRPTFNDVATNYWAAPAIEAVSTAGLVTGFPDGTFRPEAKITRAQALVILAKALGNTDNQQDSQALASYRDAQAIPSWAEDSIRKAASARIIVNYPDTTQIEPNRLATRGEVAALTYQTLASLGQNLPTQTIGLNGSNTLNATVNTPQNRRLTLRRVTLLNANTSSSLQAGDDLTIQALGTARAQASFDIEGIAQDLPMQEIAQGVYEGKYTIRRTDNQANARLTVTLRQSGVQPVTQSAANALTVDVQGPRVLSVQPLDSNGNRQPDITANFTDEQGTGLDLRSTRFILNGQDVTAQSQLTASSLRYRPLQPFTSDGVNAELRLVDRAGNTTTYPWNFRLSSTNTIGRLQPQLLDYQDESTIALPAVLRGITSPQAQVQLQVETVSLVANILGISRQLNEQNLIADSQGNFDFTLPQFNLPQGTRYRLILTARLNQQSQRTQINFYQR